MIAMKTLESHIIDFISKEASLDHDEIDVDINLGALGIGSLAGTKLIGSLEETFSLRLSPTLIFEFPTIQLLAEAIHDLSKERQKELSNV